MAEVMVARALHSRAAALTLLLRILAIQQCSSMSTSNTLCKVSR